MFCTNCGVRGEGNFCAACGARHSPPGKPADADEIPVQVVEDGFEANADWTCWHEYERLINHPPVRRRLQAAAQRSSQRITADQFMAVCDGVLGGMTGGVPVSVIAKIAMPINKKHGFRTGKQRTLHTSLPVGAAVVEVLCWLARTERTLKGAVQMPAGCRLHASLPFDLRAYEGELTVSIAAAATGTTIQAETEIAGQWYDWGKSNKALDELAAVFSRAAA